MIVFFRKIAKWLGFLILALVSYLILVILISFIPVNNKSILKASSNRIPIYIISNGVHTDIVLPIQNEHKDWLKQVSVLDTKAKDSLVNWVAFGWGDKGFYLDTPTWADLKTSTALKAVSGYNTTAMHVTFYKKIQEESNCVKFYIEPKNYEELVGYIENSFSKKDGLISKINTNAVYGNHDVFYDAKGHYSLFYTCNTWTNQALKSANQKAALWTIFDFGIFHHYE